MQIETRVKMQSETRVKMQIETRVKMQTETRVKMQTERVFVGYFFWVEYFSRLLFRVEKILHQVAILFEKSF